MSDLAVAQFSERTTIPLDMTEASMAGVETVLTDASDFVYDMPPENVDTLVELFGCYILQSAMEEFGGTFHWFQDRNQPVLMVGEPDFHVALITFDKVRGRLNGEEGDNIPFFYVR